MSWSRGPHLMLFQWARCKTLIADTRHKKTMVSGAQSPKFACVR